MEAPDNSDLLENSLILFSSFMLGLIFLAGIAANLLVLLVFYRKPGLRTTANRFVINLMLINIVACLSLLPVTLTDNRAAAGDDYLCFAEQFSSVFCSSVIVYAVLLIAIDQYFAVVDPLHYHRIISSWKGYFMIVSTWAFSAVLALLGALRPDFGIFHNSIFRQCSERNNFESDLNASSEVQKLQENSHGLYRVVFSLGYSIAAFAIPFGLITFIYYRICAAASGNSRRTRTSMLASEDCAQALRDRFHNEASQLIERPNSTGSGKNGEKKGSLTGDLPETPGLLQGGSQDSSSNPSLVVTRPSPPRPLVKTETKGNVKCECAKDLQNEASEKRTSEEHKNKIKADGEGPFLKPTLKNNQSFTKLSSLHIQFSNSIEKFNDLQGNQERRHSNVPLTELDPEFENLSKTRSSSVQSNFYDIPSRSSSSTKSTATSIYVQSSRSSSLNSTSTRQPPSRASSIRSTSSYIVHNIRHRISNASLFRYREEARAARISAMVIVMALFCWLPFFTIFSMHHGVFFGKYSYFPHYINSLSVVLLLMSTIISPFLFAFRNRQIKKEIKKIFQLCPEHLKRDCSKSLYKHNFSLNLKSQTVHLFADTCKKNPSQEKSEQLGAHRIPILQDVALVSAGEVKKGEAGMEVVAHNESSSSSYSENIAAESGKVLADADF